MNNDNTSNINLFTENITKEEPEYDFIIVGSGAGGGLLAVNLAKADYKVLLLEAGGDPLQDNNNQACERYTYSVPALHPRSTEDNEYKAIGVEYLE